MIDAQESLKAVQAGIETAINVIQCLTDAKQGIVSYTSDQKALALEKKNMEYIVENLRDEKQRLELEVDKTKKDLHDLKIELTETQNGVLNQTYTTKAPSTPLTGEAKRNEGKQGIYHNASSGRGTNYSAPSRSDLALCAISLPRRLTFEDEDLLFQCGVEEHDIDSWEEISATHVPTSSTKVSTNNKERHAKKVYWSPKKWRRMVRTHRLQSIIVANMY